MSYLFPRLFPLRLMLLSLLAIAIASCSIPLTMEPSPEVKQLEASGEASQSLATVQPTGSPPPSETPTVIPTTNPDPTSTVTQVPFSLGPIVIGHSVQGRPLEVYQFGSGPIKRMIIAGIHGGYEWNTIALADQLITILPGRRDLIPQDVTLFILRSLNPDGDHRGHGIYGRTNENEVDLNRNWPAYWQAEWPQQGCWNLLPTTAGTFPASEPETQALMQFLLNQHVDALINYHSAALGIFPGGQPPDSASLNLADTIAGVSDYPYPPLDTGCQYTGQLIDWASLNGIAAIDIELSTHSSTDLRENLIILTAFLNWRR
ncbi:MAG: hypothetical protein JSV37_05335 [Anaerolineaceae bacterium]|nr:MAG: hypothetical protein JSV37_05335 [Anaerolineaceae bacterium]